MSKKMAKENPIMKSKNAKGIKSGASEESSEVKKFIIIIVVLALLVGGIYGLTLLFAKDNDEYVYEPEKGEVNYDIVSAGMILNRPYNDYYVMVFDSTNIEASKYNSTLSEYMNKSDDKDHVKIYYCDLDNKLNKQYYNVNNDNKSNPKVKEVNDFDFGDITLLHIKKGKITEYIEDYQKIQEKLK